MGGGVAKTLPSTGTITLKQVNKELKNNETSTISLNDTSVRKLASKITGIISMNDLKGKRAEIVYTKIDHFAYAGQIPPQMGTGLELFFRSVNGELQKRNIPISFTLEEAKQLRQGSIVYSENKIFKIVFVELQIIPNHTKWSVDVYKGQ